MMHTDTGIPMPYRYLAMTQAYAEGFRNDDAWLAYVEDEMLRYELEV